MKKIEVYLAYYLGCDCVVTCNGDFSEGWKPEKLTTAILTMVEQKTFTAIKPLLRPLEDRTEEEYKELSRLISNETVHVSKHTEPLLYTSEFLWYLKNGFDIFGLIDDGLALDKTKMK